MTPAELLGIADDATAEEAKAAYRTKAQRLHPDKPDGDVVAFQALQRALKDFMKKLPCPECGGKGEVVTRNGMAVKRVKCTRCWGPYAHLKRGIK